MGRFCPWETSGNVWRCFFFICYNWSEGATGISQVEAKDAAKHPTMYSPSLPPTKDNSVPKVNSAKMEKPWTRTSLSTLSCILESPGCPQTNESESLGEGAEHQCFRKALQVIIMYPKFENHWFNPCKLENESNHQPKKIFSPYYMSTRNWRRYKAVHNTVLALGSSQFGWRTDQETLSFVVGYLGDEWRSTPSGSSFPKNEEEEGL